MSANSPRPVLVAVGETSVSVPADLTLADSPLDMMVRAAKATLHDASNNRIAAQLDTIVAVRTMSESAPHLKSPFGDAENYPRAVAQRLGITPKHALYSQIGGQTPQALVNQYAAAIAAGETRAVLIVGGEATANQKALKKAGIAADWRVLASGECDTQGVDPFDILDAAQLANELFDIAAIYTLFDHAHRARLGKTREAYAQHCANLFAPFSEVAASHSNALQNRALSAAQIAAVSEDNPAITDCYTRAMVAKDGVNQAAGLILMQEELAIEIGLDPSQFVYPLAGTESTEKTISMRTDLSSAPAMQAAYDVVFEATGLSVEDIDCFDLYSCFPIAVFCACNALGIDADDPRGLTLTGGLPFFGGPGNNYSMHAIVQLAHRLRRRSQGLGLIGANGGFLSKHAVGLYSASSPTTPFQRVQVDNNAAHHGGSAPPVLAMQANGRGRVETFAVSCSRLGPTRGFVIGRLEDNRRFVAVTDPNDKSTPAIMASRDLIGETLFVSNSGSGNRFSLPASVGD